MGATLALPLLDAMIPSMTALAADAGQSGARASGFVYMPMGCDIDALDASGRAGALTELSPTLSSLAPVMKHVTVVSNMELRNAYPGHARHVERRVPERGEGEVDREQRLLPRHDRRSDRGAADRPGDAAAVARAVDGFADSRRPVRQRLRLRLSEQSFVVVADDAAAGRGASAHRVRASVRRRRQRAGAPRGAAARRASLLDWVRDDIARLQTTARAGRSHAR